MTTPSTHSDEKVEPGHNDGTAQWGSVDDAIAAERVEKNMSLAEGLKSYWKAALWSLAISGTIIMEGYDTSLLGNAFALPQFREKYGFYAGPKKGYQLKASWQTALGQAPTVGCIIGIFIASWAQDRFGYRRTLQVSLVLITGFIFIVFFAPTVEVLFVGELLCGLPWGAFSSSAVAYASDITPVGLRGYLTTYVTMCWTFGKYISAGVVYSVQGRKDEWAYRIPFAVQWAWPIPLLVLVTLAPESPWFLVRAGRHQEAERTVARLASSNAQVVPADVVAMMVRTNQIEKDAGVKTSHIECFKGTNLRRTEVSCVAWACTVLCGSALCSQPTYFFQQVGLNTQQSFQLNLGVRAMSVLGVAGSWVMITYFGRRPMFLIGLCINALIVLLVGVLSFPADHHPAARYAQAALVMVWVFVWDLSVTVTAYPIVGETPSTRMRAKTVGLARNFYNVVGIIAGILNTYMINSTAWNWRSRAGFFWFGTGLIAIVWTYFRLPETKGRSYRELDILFERRIPARKFGSAVVDEHDEK
ncbi:Maltose permease MAL61 [Vanrija pseudolonga]|uniref:Maltose permease MAL61 n=1 Tax=Vanrija pseudolonga TaxID=143232 RepID=A0AAF0Y2K2_9TREE|nr:Maltose permease MAL61 [Vanrija pseudolonga]